MKVCLISRFFDLRGGGIGRYSMELLKGLRKCGLDVTTVRQDGGIPLGEGSMKYNVYTAFEIRFKIPESDVYHACSPMETIHAPTPLAVYFHDLIPILFTENTKTQSLGSFRKFRRWLGRYYFKMACSIALKKRNALITQSEQTKQDLVREFGVDENDVTVIRHGIKPELKPRPKNDDVFRVGTLSYLDPRKRIDLLIKAFLKADIKGELLIAGEGIDYPRLKSLAGVDPRIKFLGFILDEKLVDFYNSLDVFVFPTAVEGYGFPAVEAMATKKPVVTLADSIIPSDVKSRTIIVDDLATWFKDPHCSQIDLEKNYRFAKLHSWEKCVKEHLKVWQRILEDVNLTPQAIKN